MFDANGWTEVDMKPYSARILVVNDGSFKLDLSEETQTKSVESTSKAEEITNEDINIGRYRHFKGGVYDVIGFAKHSETGEKLVIYKSAENPDDVWARPYDMFAEIIDRDGQKIKRFAKM